MHSVENVLIVGAGMCGMSLGVALRRTGINCEIVEIRPELTEPGTGISLQGPALRALQTVGALEQCISRGFGYSYFKACDAMGNVTGTVDLPRLLGPNYPATIGILRQSVHEVLANELSKLGVPIRLSTTADTLTQDDQGVTVQFTNGETARYDLVVGADGMNSLIRDIAFGPEHKPHYTGQMVWRATVSRPRDVADHMPASLFNDAEVSVAPWPDHRHRGRRTYDYAALGQRREHRHRRFDSLGAAVPVRAFAQCSLGRLHAPALRALPYDRGKLGAARRVGEKTWHAK